MQMISRPKPEVGETWIYITGQRYEIVSVRIDSETDQEEVIYREYGSRSPLWRLDMDDFMATLGNDGDTVTCFFQRI
ncbi:MAG: DUF1653 domain-containing protein [Cyanobacteria bacterium J06627_8]